jgi:hypothetical protein
MEKDAPFTRGRRQFFQLISILSYLGSLLFQDRVLRYKGAGSLEGLLAILTLSTTMLFCYRGFTCVKRGVRLNSILYVLSVLVVASTLLTLHGQKLTSALTRVLFKSAKVIPTSIFEGFIHRRYPSQRKVNGCLALVLGSLIYFVSTDSGGKSSGAFNTMGIMFLLIGTVLDSALTCAEEHFFFKRGSYELDVYEVAFGCSLYGLLSLTVFTWIVPVFHDPFQEWTWGTWDALKLDLAAFCAASALSYILHFMFISNVGSLYADSFKAFRKIVAVIVFSVISKGFVTSPLAILGVAVCGGGLYLIETGYPVTEPRSPAFKDRNEDLDSDYMPLTVQDSVDGLSTLAPYHQFALELEKEKIAS